MSIKNKETGIKIPKTLKEHVIAEKNEKRIKFL